MCLEDMELYIKQLEDENLRLKNSNKSLRTNNKSLLEGNKKLQSQIGKFKSKRIQELKRRIHEYYEANQECREAALLKCDLEHAKHFAVLNIALEDVESFMVEIGI